MADKPMGVMPLCIIAIALGVMGFLGGAIGLVGLMVNPKTAPPGGTNEKLAELNAEFQSRVEAVAKESRPVQLILVPAMMLTSLLLAGAGIAGTKLKGLAFLKLAFAASLVIDAVGAIYGMIVQTRTMDVMKWYFKEMAVASKMPPGMEMGMQVGLYTGIFFGAGWLIAKTGVYLWGLIYFSKRSVREAFEGGPAPAAEA